MTEAEFEAIKPIAMRGRFTRGPPGQEHSLEAMAREVSNLRGAAKATDPRTRSGRQVSGSWVARELKRRGIAGKMGLRSKLGADTENGPSTRNVGSTGHSGSRMAVAVSPGEQTGVSEQEKAVPANDQEETKGLQA